MVFLAKVVVDTNVLISAILTDGSCRQLLRLLALNQKEIVVSDFILKELERFLRSKKFVHQERIPEILARIKALTATVSLPEKKLKKIRSLRDPKDQPVIQTALISDTKLIITGDEDLLSLVKVGSIRIISVKEAVALLAGS